MLDYTESVKREEQGQNQDNRKNILPYCDLVYGGNLGYSFEHDSPDCCKCTHVKVCDGLDLCPPKVSCSDVRPD